jgi:TetR/AcrR family transcriptional repressor of mexJK operon
MSGEAAVMESRQESRSARKCRVILEAATDAFLSKGYDGTSMDDIATLAAVSKPTVYKYFADKERLFAAIALASTDQVVDLVRLISDALADTSDVEQNLNWLARRFIGVLMEPRMLRLRRLIIANADRFPEVGRTWYGQGFERVLNTLATSFQELAEHGKLRLDDPLLAANHFAGLLLWIPVNQAMFSGSNPYTEADLDRYAQGAVSAFLRGYG